MSAAALFDLDGTLADSLVPLRRAYDQFLSEHGATGSTAEFDELNGPPLTEIVTVLAARHGLAGRIDVLTLRYAAIVRAAHASTPAIDGAEDVLRAVRSEGRTVALVTSAPRASADAWLSEVGLSALVDVVVGGDDVMAGKPAPEPYERALMLLRADAARSFAVEDSRTGAASAVAAGVPTWVVGARDRSGWPHGVRFVDCLRDLEAAVLRS